MTWKARVNLSARHPDGPGAHVRHGTVQARAEGELAECLDALADAAEEAAGKWGDDPGWLVSVTVELHHDSLIPSANTLAVRTRPGSNMGGLSHHSAAPIYRTVGDAVAVLETLAEAAERLYEPETGD